jgi:hypothetical protein
VDRGICQSPRDQHYLIAVGRLQNSVSIAEAEDDLNGVARELGREHPATNGGWASASARCTETVGDTADALDIARGRRPSLLVACDVALLSLMRGLDRPDETAVRLAALRPAALRSSDRISLLIPPAVRGGLLALPARGAAADDGPARLDEVALDQRATAFIGGVRAGSDRFGCSAGVAADAPGAGLRRFAPHHGRGVAPSCATPSSSLGSRCRCVARRIRSAVRSFMHLRTADSGFDPRACWSCRSFSTRKPTAPASACARTRTCSTGWPRFLA